MLLQNLSGTQIRVFRNRQRLGVIRTFERALSLTRSSIIFFSDQDDIWLPGKRRDFVQAFHDDPQCMVVVSDAEVIDGENNAVAQSFMQARGGFRAGLWHTLHKNRFLGCAMALRREVVELGLPIPAMVPMHDMWFGLLGGAIGTVRYLPAPYLQYRRHGTNATASRRAPWVTVIKWRLSLLFATSYRLCSRRLVH
jgi:hypothetical protein